MNEKRSNLKLRFWRKISGVRALDQTNKIVDQAAKSLECFFECFSDIFSGDILLFLAKKTASSVHLMKIPAVQTITMFLSGPKFEVCPIHFGNDFL